MIMVTWGMASYGSDFVQDFEANWLATFLGLMVGIPLARWVGSYQERSTEKERKGKILLVLKDELNGNLVKLKEHQDSIDKKMNASILSGVLKDESWQAFSNGGELEWIKDPILISKLSDAYNVIRNIRLFSDRFFSITQFRTTGTQTMVENHIWKALEEATIYSFSIINESLQAIEVNLKALWF